MRHNRYSLSGALPFAVTLMVFGGRAVQAQKVQVVKADTPQIVLTKEMRSEVIENVLKELSTGYVFPETAKKMEEALRKRVQAGEYEGMTSGEAFARALTGHLQAVSKDKHLRVRFSAEPIQSRRDQGEPTPQEIEQQKQFLRQVNYGFEKLERMQGNIGYIDMRMFASPEDAGNTCAAAMNFLADTDALILDLRQNGGGDPAMVAMLCSYFFNEQTHLNDLYFRPTDSTQQYWTLPYVPGKRYLGKEIYVLTSKNTFSGAEECSYNLKNLKRATLVGETTGGGAHPGGSHRLSDHFSAFIPSGRAISPITKTNWEGVGVKPDVEVPAEKALKTAYLSALKKIVEKSTQPQRSAELKNLITKLEKE